MRTLGLAIASTTEATEAGTVYFAANLFYQTVVKETVRPANPLPPVPRAARSPQPRAPAPVWESLDGKSPESSLVTPVVLPFQARARGGGTSSEGDFHPAFRQTGRGREGLSVLIKEKSELDGQVAKRDFIQEYCLRGERPQDRVEPNSENK